jgi:3-isopropylmalate/(R)-2-methylmalate dehydratase small subunit
MGIRDDGRPLGASEERLAPRAGRAWSFSHDLSAGEILPARFAATPPAEAAGRLFVDLDAGLAARFEPGDLLVAGHHLGTGAGGAAAACALAAAGFGAVIAGSFADGFDEAVLAAGLPALEVDAPAIFHTGNHLRINFEAGTIANLSSGDRQPVRNLTDELLARLRASPAR